VGLPYKVEDEEEEEEDYDDDEMCFFRQQYALADGYLQHIWRSCEIQQ
jgi:hypothetical protein